MPAGDRTGPSGMGRMTGRGAGFCAGYPVPGYMNPIPGRGSWGRGCGGGRGWRNQYYATGLPGWARAACGYPAYGYPALGGWAHPYASEPTPKEEMGMLKDQADFLKKQMEEIQSRMSTLQEAQAKEKE